MNALVCKEGNNDGNHHKYERASFLCHHKRKKHQHKKYEVTLLFFVRQPQREKQDAADGEIDPACGIVVCQTDQNMICLIAAETPLGNVREQGYDLTTVETREKVKQPTQAEMLKYKKLHDPLKRRIPNIGELQKIGQEKHKKICDRARKLIGF